MSVKIMGLVWDLDIGRDEKFILLAYADHAEHDGSNIYPAVATVARKTGYSERQVQRITHNLVEMGILIKDGSGTHGTNSFRIPIYGGSIQYKNRGDILSPVTFEAERGDAHVTLGVTFTPKRGDIAVSPESSFNRPLTDKESKQENIFPQTDIKAQIAWESALVCLKREMPKSSFDRRIKDTHAISLEAGILTVATQDPDERDWLEDHLTRTANRILEGILNRNDVQLKFIIFEEIAHSQYLEVSA